MIGPRNLESGFESESTLFFLNPNPDSYFLALNPNPNPAQKALNLDSNPNLDSDSHITGSNVSVTCCFHENCLCQSSKCLHDYDVMRGNDASDSSYFCSLVTEDGKHLILCPERQGPFPEFLNMIVKMMKSH